jgi:acyl-CoA reductase-like NAD-dependent aldehyde dehydrogenase
MVGTVYRKINQQGRTVDVAREGFEEWRHASLEARAQALRKY